MTEGMLGSADPLTRLALSHDASRFLEFPSEVVVASSLDDVRSLFAEAQEQRRRLTLRGGGTSLSGQAISDDILVDVRRRFRHIEVLDDGERVRAGAGATVAEINARLRPYGRRLGPDPVSGQSATLGGVLANNATGRMFGLSQDAFHTVESMVVVLPNGRVVDTAAPDADLALSWEEPTVAGGLAILRRRLREDPESLATIARLWSMRNAMGYQLRALTEFSKPSAMIRQLMVGSEGTLGFIAEATMRTVPVLPVHHASLAVFPTLDDAVEAASRLVELGFDAIELFDVEALRVAQSLPDAFPDIANLELDAHAALWLELCDESPDALEQRLDSVRDAVAELPEVYDVTDEAPSRPLSHLYHDVHVALAQRRPPATTLVVEDCSVPREHIVDTIRELRRLFARFGIQQPAITGHLTDCTLHFVFTERFSAAERLRKYKRFMEAYVKLVLAKDGVVKAQYGTGRAMAPFLERQVGVELYECMREIKHLFDPFNIMNRGVMFNEAPDAHLANLKLMPTISDAVDRCIECGLCEPTCPSAELTLTPRQRIVLQREIAARQHDPELLEAVAENYQYAAIDTCSAAGMCQVTCPLGIDTGELVRRQRSARTTEASERSWDRAARNWGRATSLVSTAMSTAKRIQPVARSLIALGRKRYGGDSVWAYSDDLTGGSKVRRRPRREQTAEDAVAAYFPGCQQTLLGAPGEGVFDAFNVLRMRAGVAVTLLNASRLCCGIPWSSRGMRLGEQTMTGQVRRALAPHANQPVIVDSSACTHALQAMLQPYSEPLPEIVDVVDFVATTILPKLTIGERIGSLLLYPSCANHHLDNLDALLTIAHAIADEVVIPATWNCCGAHGERGLLRPELPTAATRLAVEDINTRTFDAYASTTLTCEVAMSRVSGKPFVHILEVLASVSRG